jgi:hypothetical protein
VFLQGTFRAAMRDFAASADIFLNMVWAYCSQDKKVCAKPAWQGQTPKPFNLKMLSELVHGFRQNLQPNVGLQNRFTAMKVSLKILRSLRGDRM